MLKEIKQTLQDWGIATCTLYGTTREKAVKVSEAFLQLPMYATVNMEVDYQDNWSVVVGFENQLTTEEEDLLTVMERYADNYRVTIY